MPIPCTKIEDDMSEQKHTPGPWDWSENPMADADADTKAFADLWSNAIHGGFVVRPVVSVVIGEPEDQIGLLRVHLEATPANARLIAAAPELLEACKAALTDPDGLTDSPLQAQLRAAIANAEQA